MTSDADGMQPRPALSPAELLESLFPWGAWADGAGVLVQAGKGLCQYLERVGVPVVVGKHLSAIFREVTETGALGTRGPAASLGKPCILETLPVGSSPGSEGVQLKGAWVRAARGASPRPGAELFFPGQVYITSEAERQNTGLAMSDLPVSDLSRDMFNMTIVHNRDIVELTRHVISVESVLATYEERDSGTPFNGNAVGPFGSGTGTLLTQTEPAALVNRPSENGALPGDAFSLRNMSAADLSGLSGVPLPPPPTGHLDAATPTALAAVLDHGDSTPIGLREVDNEVEQSLLELVAGRHIGGPMFVDADALNDEETTFSEALMASGSFGNDLRLEELQRMFQGNSPFSAPNAIDANAVSQSVRLLAGGLPGGSSKRRQSWLLSSAPICPGAGSGGGSSGGTPAEGMQHVVSAYNSPLGPHRGSNDDPGKDCVSKGDKKVTELRRYVARLFREPDDPVARVLAKVDDWEFDSFELAAVTDNHPLSTLAFYLFSRTNLISALKLKEVKLARFLLRIEDGYLDNPYHNRTHAADVLRTLNAIATRGGVLSAISRQQPPPSEDFVQDLENEGSSEQVLTVHIGEVLTMLAVFLAAIIHDYEHLGLTNAFLIQDEHPLALRYNDMSPMENHHVAASLSLLLEHETNFLEHLSRNTRDAFRMLVIQMVLATDMKQHFSSLAAFNTRMDAERSKLASEARAVSFGGPGGFGGPGSGGAGVGGSAYGAGGYGASPPASCVGGGPRSVLGLMSSPSGMLHGTALNTQGPMVSVKLPSMYEMVSSGALPPETGASADGGGGNVPSDAGHSMDGTVASMAAAPRPRGMLLSIDVDEELRVMCWKMALKCADLGHLAAPWNVHTQFVKALEEEMFRQGDLEKSRGYPVSPLMDRDKDGIAKSQTGFLDAIVLPLYSSFAAVVPNIEPLLSQVKRNRRTWADLENRPTSSGT